MHSVFLYHAIQAGMDMGIVNAGQIAVYDDLDPELREACEDVVLNRRNDATERLLALADRYKGHGKEKKEADLAWREQPGDKRLAPALVHGITDFIVADVAAARAEGADSVGRSGLITPSLDEMCHVAAEMERQGFDLPLLIGGATTSRVHTAVKIHPNYRRGQAVYVTDASRAVAVTSALISREQRPGYV